MLDSLVSGVGVDAIASSSSSTSTIGIMTVEERRSTSVAVSGYQLLQSWYPSDGLETQLAACVTSHVKQGSRCDPSHCLCTIRCRVTGSSDFWGKEVKAMSCSGSLLSLCHLSQHSDRRRRRRRSQLTAGTLVKRRAVCCCDRRSRR